MHAVFTLLRQHRFLRFAVVGSIGFIADAAVLAALMQGLALHPLWARLVSLLVAITVTWWCNRHFTFRLRHRATQREWLRYCLWMLLGAAVNYGIYAGLLGVLLPLPSPVGRAIIAMAAATGITMCLNYATMRIFVFSPPQRGD